jgi:hypothetical protein
MITAHHHHRTRERVCREMRIIIIVARSGRTDGSHSEALPRRRQGLCRGVPRDMEGRSNRLGRLLDLEPQRSPDQLAAGLVSHFD